MKQTRNGIFETNSSSTHCLVVHKNPTKKDYDKEHYLGMGYFQFGREESDLVESWTRKLAYAWLIVRDLSGWKENKIGKTIKDFENIVFEISKPFYMPLDNDYNIHNGLTENNLKKFFENLEELYSKDYSIWVDHTEDYLDNGVYEKLVTDPDFVKRLVYDEQSYITVGGDEYRGYSLKTIGFQRDYKEGYNDDYKYEEDENGWPIYVDPCDRYIGKFWDKVKQYKKKFEVYFKGN